MNYHKLQKLFEEFPFLSQILREDGQPINNTRIRSIRVSRMDEGQLSTVLHDIQRYIGQNERYYFREKLFAISGERVWRVRTQDHWLHDSDFSEGNPLHTVFQGEVLEAKYWVILRKAEVTGSGSIPYSAVILKPPKEGTVEKFLQQLQ